MPNLKFKSLMQYYLVFTNCGGARDGISYGHQRRMQGWNHRPDCVIATNYTKAKNGAHGCKSSIGSPNTKSVHATKTSRIPRITKNILNILLTGSKNQFQNYEILSFTDFIAAGMAQGLKT